MRKDGVILDAKTGAIVKLIDPTSEISFACTGQSYKKKLGYSLSLVVTDSMEVQIICYNHAENSITTVHSYGEMFDEAY